MKYTVYREVFFSAAHHLRNYYGKCENIHGHNWRVRVYVTTEKLDKHGFVIDFKVLDKILKEVTDTLDHKDINSIPPFTEENPTAENISLFLFNACDDAVKKERSDIFVAKIAVWESEKSCAIIER